MRLKSSSNKSIHLHFFGPIFIECYYLLSAVLGIRDTIVRNIGMVSAVGLLGYFQFINRKKTKQEHT